MMTKKTNAKSSEPLTTTTASQSHAPSVLKVADVNGAPGWLLDGQPYVPVFGQAGGGGLCELRDGKLWLQTEQRVRTAMPEGVSDSFAVACKSNFLSVIARV